MRAKSPSRPREQRPAGKRAARSRPSQWDRRLLLLVAGAIVAALVYVRTTVHPDGAMFWSYQVVMLCLVVAAVAGRALLGHHSEAAGVDDRWRRLERAAVPLIAVAAVLPYLPTLTIGLLSDDFGLTSSIAHSGGPAHLLGTRPFASLWRPLHAIAWWVQYRLWGPAAFGYHAVAILFHAANAVLVYALGRRIITSFPGALLAGLLFAVHPIHTGTVAWASCQPDLQCALFALLSLLCLETYLRVCMGSPREGLLHPPDRPCRSGRYSRLSTFDFRSVFGKPHQDLPESRDRSPWLPKHALRARRGLRLGGALLTFFLALLSKEAALALPGVAVLRVALVAGGHRWRRTLGVGAAYGAVLALYLALRLVALGRFGGYRLGLSFWNTAFPSAPLRQTVEFFFPINQAWLIASAPWLWWPLVVAMGVFLLWCTGRLSRLPAPRLLLYGGFVVLMAVPAWAYPTLSPDMEYVRFAYLPTVGLVWLVGEVLGTGAGRRKSVTFVGMLAVGVFCLWSVMPWRAAGELAASVVTAGKRMVEQTPASPYRPVFFVRNLPDTKYGALVFRNGFPHALTFAMGKPVLVEVVSRNGDVPPEVMSLSDLLPGEYLVTWDASAKQMKLLRSGAAEGRR